MRLSRPCSYLTPFDSVVAVIAVALERVGDWVEIDLTDRTGWLCVGGLPGLASQMDAVPVLIWLGSTLTRWAPTHP